MSRLCFPSHDRAISVTSACDLHVKSRISHFNGTLCGRFGTSRISYLPSLYMVVRSVGLCSIENSSYSNLLTSDDVP